jgi:hypothetical protein
MCSELTYDPPMIRPSTWLLLAATARRFPLTPLVYTLIAIHATILMVGGHYTYAEVPLGDWDEGRVRLRTQPWSPVNSSCSWPSSARLRRSSRSRASTIAS